MPARSFREARCPCWNSSSEASKGRQVIRSPAVPPCNLVLSTPLYSAGAVGANTTFMFGYLASKAGMIVSSQMDRSSLRQLSIVNVTASPLVAGGSVASASGGGDDSGGGVAAGGSVTTGACVGVAPPPQAVKISESATKRLTIVNVLRIFFSFSYLSCNRTFV